MIEVVGMGDDGWDGLTPGARAVIEGASVLVGGARHLDLVPRSGTGARVVPRYPWPTPLLPQVREFFDDLGPDVVVLASGDPLRSGIATTLIREFGPERVRVHPAVSSDTLARARMGWSAESVDVVTLVGRSPRRLLPFLTPGARLVVLCSNGDGPAQVADLLVEAGAPDALLVAWWNLGGPGEGSRSGAAGEWDPEPTPDLVLVCVEVPHETPMVAAGPAPGRPDDLFDHDGLITKRDVRAGAVARLRPTSGAVLWDLGAGSGAVGIEWALAARDAHVVSVESRPERAERVETNARAWGVDDRVTVVRSTTLDAVRDTQLPDPDAVFVGGGLSQEVLTETRRRLRPGGRLVAHAVTAESEQILLAAAAEHGGDLVRMTLEHLEPLGRYRSWRPARAVVAWSHVKASAAGPAHPEPSEENPA